MVFSTGTASRVAALVGCVVLSACADDDDVRFSAVTWPDAAEVDLDDVRGTPTLLAGWATWCVPCERELPMLDDAVDAGVTDGVDVIAVNVDAGEVGDDELAEMLTRLDVDLPVWRDPDQQFLTAFGGPMMPFSVLLDGDGAVVRTWIGTLDVDGDDFLDALDAVT